ncbi:MAG: DUF3151 family protein [Acidimicrobiales bacterium]
MPNESSVPLSQGLPESVLPPAPAPAQAALADARAVADDGRKAALATVAAAYPRYLDAWAELAEISTDDVEGYAYARVGYHRGLDAVRAAGWRGSGYVRWRHPSNRGFLRALDQLRARAAAIGESDEAERCNTFLHQLDPDWDRRDAG